MNISKLCIFQCRCIFYFSCGGVVVVVGGDGGGGTTKFSLVKMVEGGRRTPRGVYIEPLYPPPLPSSGPWSGHSRCEQNSSE